MSASDQGPSGEFLCKDCGQPVHRRTSNKTGKRYTAEYFDWNSDDGEARRRFYRWHNCQPVEGLREAVQAKAQKELATAIAEGRVVKGATIEVVKGRKVPLGTKGIVFWVANGPDGYGVVKVGFTTTEGDKHFINVANVKVSA